jgi:hypothetical protein
MSDTPDDEVQAAFPDRYRDGMTLRDYFAAQALQGQLSRPNAGYLTEHDHAEYAYMMADAMMKAREA